MSISPPVRVLLDESPPIELAVALAGTTVVDRGWSGLSNGELQRERTAFKTCWSFYRIFGGHSRWLGQARSSAWVARFLPVWKFRSFEEAERALPPSPTGQLGLETALALSRLDSSLPRGVRVSLRGVFRYRTIAEAEAHRERHAMAQLKAADRGGGSR